MKRLLFLFLFILGYNIIAYSQKTFNYLQTDFSGANNSCNVLIPSVSIDGVLHNSWAGGVTFNSTKGLGLATQQKNSPFSSTAFRIDYSFATGKSYLIKIDATGNQYVSLKASIVQNVTNFNTSSQTACTLDASAFSYDLAGYGQFSTPTTTTSTTYTIPQFDIPLNGTPCQYLFIWASGGRPNLDLDGLNISKITITETPITPTISFTLAPSPSSITCGSVTPVTFNITNVANTQGVTGYTWNLGSPTNGWKLSNGAAAPQFITTNALTNTLTLTPTCGAALSSITAIATIGTTNYNTNIGSVTLNQPSIPSITGNDAICTASGSTSTYSISTLPCNSNLTWSIIPTTGIASLTTSGNSCTLTKTGNGVVTLTATVIVCGQTPILKTKTVVMGSSPGGIGIVNYSNMTLCDGNTSFRVLSAIQPSVFNFSGNLNVNSTVPSNSIVWSLPPGFTNNGWTWTASGSTVTVSTKQSNSNLTLRATGTNACGTVFKNYSFTSGPCNVARMVSPSFTIQPNPTRGTFTVSNNLDKNAIIKEVVIRNKIGIIVKEIKLKVKAKELNIDIQELSPDFYFVQIFDGTKWQSIKIIKE